MHWLLTAAITAFAVASSKVMAGSIEWQIVYPMFLGSALHGCCLKINQLRKK